MFLLFIKASEIFLNFLSILCLVFIAKSPKFIEKLPKTGCISPLKIES